MDTNNSKTGDIQALNNKKGFKIAHLNIRSLVKKMDQLRIMLQDSNIDVFTLSETWLEKSLCSNLFKIWGYETIRQDRAYSMGLSKKKKRGGGLITYVHQKHSGSWETLTECNTSTKDLEANWVLLQRAHCKDAVICNLYRPPSGCLQKAIDYLCSKLESISLDKTEVFLIGDLNVNFKNKLSADYKKLDFFIRSNGLTQLISNTTRNTDKSKSLIDVILTNAKYIDETGVLDHYLSDHLPIFMVKKKRRDSRPTVEFEGRSYRNYNSEMLHDLLVQCEWDDFYDARDPNNAWDLMVQKFMPIIDKMCPKRKFVIKNYRPEWVTHELLELIKDRDHFYKRARVEGDEDSWNIARYLRNLTNSGIRRARREYVLEELEQNDSDYKKFWKSIRSVIPNNKGSSPRDILLKNDGERVDKGDVAHFINDYFINVGNCNLQEEGNQGVLSESGNLLDPPPPWSFEKFKETEVYKVVKGINVTKSSGMEDLSSYMLKEIFLKLIPEITHLFNLSIRSGCFPDAWKDALVIPIPKEGNSTKVQNYRPISLLPLPGKLLEKLIHSQLSKYLEDAELLVSTQHGFRKGHSTIHSVAQLVNFINTKMDQGFPTLATYIDFKKAFDCVQHPILLAKIREFNISQEVLAWVESYLSERRQRVLANNIYSSFQTIRQGVPQGSVLGPLLYIMYANDVVKRFKNCSVAQYADDTVLYVSDANFCKAVDKMQKDLSALERWCIINGIRANTGKTKVMLFGNAQKMKSIPDFEVKLNDIPLQQVTSYKYLGVTLDNRLKFDKHVRKTLSSVAGKLKLFRRMRSFLNDKAALLVYKNMLLPIIEYGDILLTGTTSDNKRKLQTLQNKGLRCALKRDNFSSSEDLHKDAKLLKLKFRREQHLLNFMYDMSLSQKNLKKTKSLGVRTRSSSKKLLKIRRPRTEKFKNSLTYRGPKKWNALPEEVQRACSKHLFKAQISRKMELKALADKADVEEYI